MRNECDAIQEKTCTEPCLSDSLINTYKDLSNGAGLVKGLEEEGKAAGGDDDKEELEHEEGDGEGEGVGTLPDALDGSHCWSEANDITIGTQGFVLDYTILVHGIASYVNLRRRREAVAREEEEDEGGEWKLCRKTKKKE